MPVELTELPFMVMAAALTVKVPSAEVLPKVPFSTTLPLVPEALIVKLSGVLSLFNVLPTVITAELLLATKATSPASVTAPPKV